MTSIHFHAENIPLPLKKIRATRSWLANVITEEKSILGDLNYIFCSDEHLLQINKEYLDHDYYTDIITFDYTEENTVSGDLFISIDRIRDNAKTRSLKVRNELDRVLVHGLLHLLGYKDKTQEEQAEMRSKEDYYLNLRQF